MRYLLIIVTFLALTMPGCAITGTTTTPTVVVQSQRAAEQSLLAVGAILRSTPGTMDALYASGKVTREQYNSVTAIYNRALASYTLAVDALKAAMLASQDPQQSTAYLSALSTFLLDQANLNALLTAMGGTP